MLKTNKTRYADAVRYLESVDDELATAVKTLGLGRESTLGGMISLGGKSYNADADHRAATRALLLCIATFFGKPHASSDEALNYYLTEARTRYKAKTKTQVDAEFEFYAVRDDVSLDGMVLAATTVKSSGPVEFAPFRLRTDTNVGPSPICYDGVFNWLYAAGFISRRWLGGVTIHASTIHQHLGDGQIVSPTDWDKIEKGYIWNIYKKTSRDTCHWGVSLGVGRAAGCNNTGQGRVKYEDTGKDAYGVFDFVELCKVLETTEKYRGVNQKVSKGVVDGPLAATTSSKDEPLGSFIEVRKYNPLRGKDAGIYY